MFTNFLRGDKLKNFDFEYEVKQRIFLDLEDLV